MWFCLHETKRHGIQIGKATKNEFWYGLGGLEYCERGTNFLTGDVFFECGFPESWRHGDITLEGYGPVWFALAQTAHGNIPGKASRNACWYTLHGREYMITTGFWYFNRANLQYHYDKERNRGGYGWCLPCYVTVKSSVIYGSRCNEEIKFILLSGRVVRHSEAVLCRTFVGYIPLDHWVYEDDSSPWLEIEDNAPTFISQKVGCAIREFDPIGIFDDETILIVVGRTE